MATQQASTQTHTYYLYLYPILVVGIRGFLICERRFRFGHCEKTKSQF